jgi:DNA-binding SARP family transcriptional activator/tetratricopeptide (TPR) repeat protein
MRVNILGKPELLGDEHPVRVSEQLWCVLVSLVYIPGEPVMRDVLVRHLWGDYPPDGARGTVRTYIRKVEQRLSEAAGRDIRITRPVGGGYALDITRQEVDLCRFRELIKSAEVIAQRGEQAAAATLLRQAESLWRGEALAGLRGDWVAGIRVALHEERRRAIIRRVRIELDLGQHAELLSDLAELSERYPDDGELVMLRMIALYRAERQADALSAYQEFGTRMISSGLEPPPEMRDVYVAILRHDPAIRSPKTMPESVPPVCTLPPAAPGFVGRAREIAVLTQTETHPSVVIIEGMSGIGKTALAVRAGALAAQRYPDAQLYLNLGPVSAAFRPVDALRDLLLVLGLEPGGTLAACRQQWCDVLTSRRMVVVLDDAPAPGDIRPLIPDSGDCLIIVTSNRRCDWAPHEVLRLEPLPEQDAAALFATITGVSGESEQLSVAAGLCGGSPLVIELAATRLRELGMSGIDDLLRDLGALRDGHGAPEPMNSHLNATFDLVYRELPTAVQQLFRYRGASPGRDVTARSAAALAEISIEAATAGLRALRDRYLLEEKAPDRYEFHDLIRSYASALARKHDTNRDIRAAIHRLADHYVREAERDDQSWFVDEYDNILLIAEYCGRHEDTRRCVGLVRSVSGFLERSGHWGHAARAYEAELKACQESGDIHGIARGSSSLSSVCMRTGRLTEALDHASRASAMYERVGDWNGRAGANDRAGVVCRYLARFDGALAHHRVAIDIYRSAHNDIGMANAMVHAASTLHFLGRHDEEWAHLTGALEIFRQYGDRLGQAIVHNSIGIIQLRAGRYRDAIQNFRSSITILHQFGDRQFLALLQQNMGRAYLYRERHDDALIMLRGALAEFRALGDLRDQVYTMLDIGSVLREEKRYPEAARFLQAALITAEQVGDSHARGTALCALADTSRESGAVSTATSYYEQAGRVAAEMDAPYLKACVKLGLADAAMHAQDADTARIYWLEALDLFTRLKVHEADAVEARLEALNWPHWSRPWSTILVAEGGPAGIYSDMIPKSVFRRFRCTMTRPSASATPSVVACMVPSFKQAFCTETST